MKTLFYLFLLLASSNNLYACCSQQDKADFSVIEAASIAMENDLNRQKAYLEEALKLCPQHPIALNNLGLVYEEKGLFSQSLKYYKQALKVDPNLKIAWMGVGDVYQKQGQLPQALEAYSHNCNDGETNKKMVALLKNNAFRDINSKQVLNQQSLSVLFNKQRQYPILKRVRKCIGLTRGIGGDLTRGLVSITASFRNFNFDSGSARLKNRNNQLDEFITFLKRTQKRVIIKGHTDRMPFRGKNRIESQRLNDQLSSKRAESLKQALVFNGINPYNIVTKGFGSRHLLDPAKTAAADQRNRRVEMTLY